MATAQSSDRPWEQLLARRQETLAREDIDGIRARARTGPPWSVSESRRRRTWRLGGAGAGQLPAIPAVRYVVTWPDLDAALLHLSVNIRGS